MVRPKKHLGQHFLTDEDKAKKIVDAINLPAPKEVLEVGPGMGVLTKYLIKKYWNFKAFDVDQESIEFLKEEFPTHADDFHFKDFLDHETKKSGVVVIGNFPYNISSQLFFRIWEERNRIDQVVCMVQKEVAHRICANHGNKTYGILSVLLQAYYEVEYLFTVPPGAFRPPPKVQSGVVRLTRNQVKELPCDDLFFKRVVKSAFGKRRKTLRNALKDLDLPQELTADEVFGNRAEQLSVEDFIRLTKTIEQWKAQ